MSAQHQEIEFKGRGLPAAQGLYHPDDEKDACGVGFICNLSGEKSHSIIFDAIHILCRLSHRGASSSDNRTGDGAGLCLQVPDEFCRGVTNDLGIALPAAGDYATGLFFLPVNTDERGFCKRTLERICTEQGQRFLGWRCVLVSPPCGIECAASSRQLAVPAKSTAWARR